VVVLICTTNSGKDRYNESSYNDRQPDALFLKFIW